MGFFSDILPAMAPMIGAGAGSAIGGPVGGIIGQGIGQSVADREAAKRANAEWERNAALQREFAQHGVRWKVEDAKAAGIHPLAALGAATHSASPMQVGGSPQGDFGAMGQDITRAITATKTADERALSTLQIQSAQLDMQGKALDNQIKQSQLNKLNQVGPAFPGSSSFISGQGNSGPAVIEKPLERTRSLPGAPQAEAGSIPDIGWAQTKTGVVPVPSSGVKERIEDNMPHEWSHFLRNNVFPDTSPPDSALPKGAAGWKWNQLKMEWQPRFPEKGPHKYHKPSPSRTQRTYYKPSA